jgi:hypothetical protein
MGIERAVTRWYVRRQLLQDEITAQQVHLAVLRFENLNTAEFAEAELTAMQARLHDLGPCPQPMMG